MLWPGQNEIFVLKSTGGFTQRDGSPCMVIIYEVLGLRNYGSIDLRTIVINEECVTVTKLLSSVSL